MRSLQAVTLFFLLASVSTVLAIVEAPTFFEDYQQRMRHLVTEIEQRLSNKPPNCTCSHFACGPYDNRITECINAAVTEDLDCPYKPCSHRKGSKTHAFFHVPPDTSLSSSPVDVKRDICMMQDLEDLFREFRNDDEDIVYRTILGAAATGVTASWPGIPQRREEGVETCESFDPRIEPWWRAASYYPKNVVILIDVSNNEGNFFLTREDEFDMEIRLAQRLLETFGENDAFQIVTFDLEVEELVTDSITSWRYSGMIEATTANVQSAKQKLDGIERTNVDEVDIGKALKRAFDLLKDNKTPSSRGCENHIILIDANRDCAFTTSLNCTSKKHAKLEEFESLNNATAVMLDFVEDELEGNFDIKPSLFAFSINARSNEMLSELACHFNGLHVDVTESLQNRIVDPLHTMYGYFAKLALSSNKSSHESHSMAIDLWRDNDRSSDFMSTFSIPVFFRGNDENCPPIHFGVIQTEITENAYEKAGVNAKTAGFVNDVNRWNNGSKTCFSYSVTPCEMQVLRQTECVVSRVDRHDGTEARCIRYKENHYYINYTAGPGFNLTGFGFVATKTNCEALGGEMVTPIDSEERRFLASIIPPDGVWVDAELRGQFWLWPNGEKVEGNVEIGRTCDIKPTTRLYMNRRGYENNFHCTQQRTLRTFFCKFPGEEPPKVCEGLKILEVDKNEPLPGTLERCGMTQCMPSYKYPGDMKISDIVCSDSADNDGDSVCCTPDEIRSTCDSTLTSSATEMGTLGEKTDDEGSETERVAMMFIFLVVACAISCTAIALSAVLCMCGWRYSTAQSYTGLKGSHPVGFQTNNLQLVVQQTKNNEFVKSPFEFDPNDSPRPNGKRPELVVNIEVKVLDNGWEKSGGCGRVRQGEYTDSHGQVHLVAVKFVDALAPTAAWKALRNEFEILSTIPLHPNIVRPIGANWGYRTGESERYIVEELMYTNLGDVISGSEPCPFPGKTLLYRDWIRIFIDIASGLQHLHQNKIIHFDLKPRNVLLTEDMIAKLADFGCSKEKFETYIKLSAMAGTPPYLAPECWISYYSPNNRAEVARAKIDIYSFGVMLWECISNDTSILTNLHISSQKLIFPSCSSANHESSKSLYKAKAIQSSGEGVQIDPQHNLPETIPAALRALISACIKFNFDSRPSCEQILDALHSMLSEEWTDQPPA